MFSFLKRLRKDSTAEEVKESLPQSEHNRHRNLGRDIAKSLTDSIDSHISSRAVSIKIGYLKYFQGQVEKSIAQEDISPLSLAKMEYESLVENTSVAVERLCKEVMDRVDNEWIEVLKALNLDRELIIKLIDSKVNEAFHSIPSDGIEILEERADRLKAAEDVWQQKLSNKGLDNQPS